MSDLWLTIILVLGACFVFLYALEQLIRRHVGDAKVEFILEEQSDFIRVDNGKNETTLSFTMPIKNIGKQIASVFDIIARLLPEDRYEPYEIRVWPDNLNHPPRTDGYMEAFLLKFNKQNKIRININIKAKDEIEKALKDIKLLRIDVLYKYYGRTPIVYRRYNFILPVDKFKPAESRKIEQPQKEDKPAHPVIEGVFPIKTELIHAGDNLIEIIKHYTKDKANQGDIIVAAESVTAITQGRLIYVEDVKPTFWARRLNLLFDQDSSLPTIYGMQLAIQEAGLWRILLSITAGVLGKLVGRKGDFYRLAGRKVATIDETTGTMPPYDKHIVLGPDRIDQVVAEIKKETGLEAAIVDVNDLYRVDILAVTDGIDKNLLTKALLSNPHGNAAQQTPLVLIKPNLLRGDN